MGTIFSEVFPRILTPLNPSISAEIDLIIFKYSTYLSGPLKKHRYPMIAPNAIWARWQLEEVLNPRRNELR